MQSQLVDANGFAVSFASEDIEGIQSFFDEYGFVVVEGILSEDDVSCSLDEVWNQIEEKSREMKRVDCESKSWWRWLVSYVWDYPSVSRNKPNTWEKYWPFSKNGIFPDIARGTQLFENRQSEKACKVFETVIGNSDLLVSLDRFGFIKSGVSQHWLHWDLNPWFASGTEKPTYLKLQNMEQRNSYFLERWQREHSAHKIFLTENNGVTSMSPHPVQGLFALSDNNVDEGGFMCIPGFHKKIKQWSEENPMQSEHTHIKVPTKDPCFDATQIVRIPLKKGSLLIWSSALPHCNYSGTKERVCQYIKMIPKEIYPPSILQQRSKQVRNLLPAQFILTETGKKIFSINNYAQDKEKI